MQGASIFFVFSFRLNKIQARKVCLARLVLGRNQNAKQLLRRVEDQEQASQRSGQQPPPTSTSRTEET